MSVKSPAYWFCLNQIKNQEFLNIHSCAIDFIEQEPEGWVDIEYSKQEIRKALQDIKK